MKKLIAVTLLVFISIIGIALASKNTKYIKKDINTSISLNTAIEYMKEGKNKMNYKKAVKIMLPLCEKKVTGACHLLGKLYENGGYGLEKNLEKSMIYKKMSCEYGSGFSCFNISKTLFKQDEDQKAFVYLEKSCDSNYTQGCQVLGLLYEGKSKKQDYKKAIFFHNKACNLNDSLSCYSEATFYLKGLGVAINYKKAIKLFKKSSSLGNKLASDRLKFLKRQNNIRVGDDNNGSE